MASRLNFNKEDIETLISHYKNKGLLLTSKAFGISKTSVLKLIKQNNINFNHKTKVVLDKQQIDILIKEYQSGLTMMLLADKYNVDAATISNILKRNNIQKRDYNKKNKLRDNYFEKIDTEAKAYFLGLICADGCVLDTKGRSLQLSINLQAQDGYVLERFAKDIGFTGKIPLYSYSGEKRKNCQDFYLLKMSSNRLCEDLIKMGVTPRKSLTLNFPSDVPDYLIHHFIRGYFDGDGWITISNSGAFGVCGTFEFLNKLNQILNEKVLGISSRKIYKEINNKIHTLEISGNNMVRKFYEFIYKDARLFLKRKRDKMEKIFLIRRIIKTSKYKNISYQKDHKRWIAIHNDNTRQTFKTELEAYTHLCEYEFNNNIPFSNDPSAIFDYQI